MLAFYAISNEMAITQNYEVILMRFSEEIIAGISKYKDGKISWSVIKVITKFWSDWVQIGFSEIWMFCNPIIHYIHEVFLQIISI